MPPYLTNPPSLKSELETLLLFSYCFGSAWPLYPLCFLYLCGFHICFFCFCYNFVSASAKTLVPLPSVVLQLRFGWSSVSLCFSSASVPPQLCLCSALVPLQFLFSSASFPLWVFFCSDLVPLWLRLFFASVCLLCL